MKNYFKRHEVSNSDLKSLARAYRVEADPFGDRIQTIFNFGSLIDALRTAAHLLVNNRLYNDDLVTFVTLTEDELEKGFALNKFLNTDRLMKLFSDTMIGQFVFLKRLNFTYEGRDYFLRARCKFDHFTRREYWSSIRVGIDYKTTAATSQRAFEASIEHFDWDQGAAFYMDIAQIDYFWLIGICKTKNEIFKFAIRRGDAMYLRGRAKYARWAYQWVTLIESFESPTPKIIYPYDQTVQISAGDKLLTGVYAGRE